MRFRYLVAVFAILLPMAPPGIAAAEADGPDAWDVTGIAPGDTLNMRMGPGTQYPVIATLPHDATGLSNITCTPYSTLAIWEQLSEAERASLPSRWCFVFHQASGTKGWVSGRFLAEASGSASASATMPDGRKLVVSEEGDASTGLPPDPEAEAALRLVSDLMVAVRAQEQGGPSPLQMPLAADFFAGDMIARIDPGMIGADPIIGGQDSRLEDISVEPDPDQPPLRGLYPVRVQFVNFGQLRTVTFYLRADTQAAPQMRIIRFEADGEVYE